MKDRQFDNVSNTTLSVLYTTLYNEEISDTLHIGYQNTLKCSCGVL